jgi:ubiquinone/menaquinone biosynthesis C-methylase UbiE
MPLNEQWQMTGSGPEAYERHLVPAIFAPWATQLLKLARLQHGERVLDAACGTGIVARMALADVGAAGMVTGADLNTGMLEVARACDEARAIDWREGTLEDLPCADGEFDVVLCQQGLQFSAQQVSAAREMHRVLRRQGRVVISVWRQLRYCPYMVAVTSALAEHVGPEASERMSAPCLLGSADELLQLLRSAGFEDIRLRVDVLIAQITALGAFLTGQFVASPIAADIGGLEDGARAALFADIERRLSPYVDDATGALAVPFEAHSAIAYR